MANSQTENTTHTRRACIGYARSELRDPIATLVEAILNLQTAEFCFLTFYNVTNYHRKDRRDCVVF